jgi:uncharacterized protein YqhQ
MRGRLPVVTMVAVMVAAVVTVMAILDRILHRAELIQITGKSYRLKDRASKSNRACQEEKKAS